MYKIGELSRCLGVTVKTLRYWSELGLLVPDEIDRFTGYRYYGTEKLAECGRIIALKELGFSLEEIGKFSDGDRAELIEAKTRELERLIDITDHKLKRLRELRSELEDGKNMFDIITRQAGELKSELRFETVRKIFSDRNEALDELKRLKGSIPKRLLGQRAIIVNYDTDYRETDLDLVIGVEVDAGGKPIEVGREDLVMTMITNTKELQVAYSELFRRMGNDGLQLVGAISEIIHDGGVVELRVPVCRLSENPCKSVERQAFENDPEAVGKWKLLDIVPTRGQFVYGHPKSSHDSWQDEFYLLDGGSGYWVYEGWTKGMIYTHSPAGTLGNSYSLVKEKGRTLMFQDSFESCDRHGIPAGKPYVRVYEKLDGIARKPYDIKFTDDIELQMIPDERVIGEWKVIDLLRDLNDFGRDKRRSGLFLEKLSFEPDGKCVYSAKDRSWTKKYTKGVVIDEREKLACHYELRELDGREYLILEWKSGDYVFGRKINWYVLER